MENTFPWSAAWSGLAPLVHMTAVNVSCLAFGLWHVLAARHVTSFNPVFADLPGGQLGRVYGVVVAVSGTAVAGLVLCWVAVALPQPARPGAGVCHRQRAWLWVRLPRLTRSLTGTFGGTS
jgi:hypothetical protein